MHNPYIAVVAAALAAWIFGAVWYMALSKPYQIALGLNPDDCKDKKMPLTPLLVCFAAEIVVALVMSWLFSGLGVVSVVGGAVSGLFLGTGFMAPATVVNNAFPGRKPMLSLIDGAHWVGVAVIEGMVLVALS